MPTKFVAIADIDLDGSPHTRERLRDDVIADYAELYKERKGQLPNVELFKPSDSPFFLVADGLHRISAAQKLGFKSILANVTGGTWADCMKKAAGCNVTHGLRRSPEDKHCLIEDMFRHGADRWTDKMIAEVAHVSVQLVSKTRKMLEEHKTIKEAPKRTNVNGEEQTVSGGATEKVLHDWTGYPIPIHLKGLFGRRKEAQILVDTMEQLRKTLYLASMQNDELFAEMDFNEAAADIQKLKTNLKLALPYAVCPQCQGQTAAVKDCPMCKGRGMISEFRYKTVVPVEIRALRVAVINQKK